MFVWVSPSVALRAWPIVKCLEVLLSITIIDTPHRCRIASDPLSDPGRAKTLSTQ
jgi:hypothetical protein